MHCGPLLKGAVGTSHVSRLARSYVYPKQLCNREEQKRDGKKKREKRDEEGRSAHVPTRARARVDHRRRAPESKSGDGSAPPTWHHAGAHTYAMLQHAVQRLVVCCSPAATRCGQPQGRGSSRALGLARSGAGREELAGKKEASWTAGCRGLWGRVRPAGEAQQGRVKMGRAREGRGFTALGTSRASNPNPSPPTPPPTLLTCWPDLRNSRAVTRAPLHQHSHPAPSEPQVCPPHP